MQKAAERMKDVVLSHMRQQEAAGKLSLAHGYDHVENVARYAALLAPWFGRRLGVQDPDQLAPFAAMAGWSHDVVRYASQTDSGEEASAALLESVYGTEFSPLIPREDYQRFVVDVVRNGGKSFSAVMELYKDDPEVQAVALAVTAGDKLIEASGPRVLERRSFFVGRERMRNPEDLGGVFQFPTESPQGVLTETMVRLGDVNHISNYAAVPPLLALAQELHSPQYHWYDGLLMGLGMAEPEAVDYLVQRLKGSPATQKLADRVEKGGRRLAEERHLDGTYFVQHNLDTLLQAVRAPRKIEDRMESSVVLIHHFAGVESPNQAIEAFEKAPSGPPTFRKWMQDIAAYRRGDFGQELLARLEKVK